MWVHEHLSFANGGGGVFRSGDCGRIWEPLAAGLANSDVYALAFDSTGRFLYAGTGDGVFAMDLATSGCPEGSLCLNQGRFRVSVTWHAVHLGTRGIGHPVPRSGSSGRRIWSS